MGGTLRISGLGLDNLENPFPIVNPQVTITTLQGEDAGASEAWRGQLTCLGHTAHKTCSWLSASIHPVFSLLITVALMVTMVIFKPRRKWQPTPVFLPGKSHGQRSLLGYIVHGVVKSRTQLSG